MIYNFRFDKSHIEEILRRLREEKLLSQGWGGGEQGRLDIRQEDYVTRCFEFYDLTSTRIPSNLTWMREFKDGDLLVTPHLPEHGKVSIHIIDGDWDDCYDYLECDDTHLNNRIRIRESYGLDGNIDARNARLSRWRGKLQWLRYPVIPIERWEEDFKSVIRMLAPDPNATLRQSDLDEYLELLTSDVLSLIRERLYEVMPSGTGISFEAICERLLSSFGYRIEGRNEYDREGGDVDLRCVREHADISPFESGQTTLLVQVKKHTGTTDRHAVEQVRRMMRQYPSAEGCVMSLADSFSEEAEELARIHGILLMGGDEICRLLLDELAKSQGESA